MRSITSGSVSISVPKIRKKNKLPLHVVILNLISVIQLLTYSVTKMLHSSVFSLLEAVVPMELTASTIIGYQLLKIANKLTKIKTFLGGQDSALSDRI